MHWGYTKTCDQIRKKELLMCANNHTDYLHTYRYADVEVYSQLINDVTLKYPETLKPNAFECTGQRKTITQ